MFAVKSVAVNVLLVLTIFVPAVVKLSKDDSHRATEPVFPLNVSTVEFVPVQTVVLLAMDPPTVAGDTVMVADELLTSEQTPLLTIAL